MLLFLCNDVEYDIFGNDNDDGDDDDNVNDNGDDDDDLNEVEVCLFV